MPGVHGGSSTSGSHYLSVQRGWHGDLTQVQGELDVPLAQGFAFSGIGIGVGGSHQVDGGVIEVHLDGHFLLRHQQLASVKQWRVGGEEQGVELASGKRVHGFFQGFHIGLLRVYQLLVIVMDTIHCVGGEDRGCVEIIEPALRFQQGVSLISVVVQEGLKEGFVMVMICLGFQEDTIDVDRQLFDHGVRQIGDGVQDRTVRQIAAIALLESDCHFKITSVQIDKGVGGRNQKFHGIDARGQQS